MEFSAYRSIERSLGMPVYFVHPLFFHYEVQHFGCTS